MENKHVALRLKRPCKNCPFRKDIFPFLTVERVELLLDELIRQGKSFHCHETIDYDRWVEDSMDMDKEDQGYTHNGEESLCAGSLILMKKIDQPNQLMQVVERLGITDFSYLENRSVIYDTQEDMLEAYKKANP